MLWLWLWPWLLQLRCWSHVSGVPQLHPRPGCCSPCAHAILLRERCCSVPARSAAGMAPSKALVAGMLQLWYCRWTAVVTQPGTGSLAVRFCSVKLINIQRLPLTGHVAIWMSWLAAVASAVPKALQSSNLWANRFGTCTYRVYARKCIACRSRLPAVASTLSSALQSSSPGAADAVISPVRAALLRLINRGIAVNRATQTPGSQARADLNRGVCLTTLMLEMSAHVSPHECCLRQQDQRRAVLCCAHGKMHATRTQEGQPQKST